VSLNSIQVRADLKAYRDAGTVTCQSKPAQVSSATRDRLGHRHDTDSDIRLGQLRVRFHSCKPHGSAVLRHTAPSRRRRGGGVRVAPGPSPSRVGARRRVVAASPVATQPGPVAAPSRQKRRAESDSDGDSGRATPPLTRICRPTAAVKQFHPSPRARDSPRLQARTSRATVHRL
jgi:hypothetical protein